MIIKLVLCIIFSIGFTYLAYKNSQLPGDSLLPGDSFFSQSPPDKITLLWHLAEQSTQDPSIYPWFDQLARFALPETIGGEDVNMDNTDLHEIKEWGVKSTHSRAWYAKINVNFEDVNFRNQYTGLFKEEKLECYIRIASAPQPVFNPQTQKWSSSPGLSFKCFRWDNNAANFISINDLYNTDTANPMDVLYSNHTNKSPFKLNPLYQVALKFSSYSEGWYMLGLSDFARWDIIGNPVEGEVKAPFNMVLAGTNTAWDLCEQNATVKGDKYACLPYIGVGTKMFEIHASAAPIKPSDMTSDCHGLDKVGSITVTSEWIESSYQDTHVRAKHVFWEDNLDHLDNTSGWDQALTDDYAYDAGARKWNQCFDARN